MRPVTIQLGRQTPGIPADVSVVFWNHVVRPFNDEFPTKARIKEVRMENEWPSVPVHPHLRIRWRLTGVHSWIHRQLHWTVNPYRMVEILVDCTIGCREEHECPNVVVVAEVAVLDDGPTYAEAAPAAGSLWRSLLDRDPDAFRRRTWEDHLAAAHTDGRLQDDEFEFLMRPYRAMPRS